MVRTEVVPGWKTSLGGGESELPLSATFPGLGSSPACGSHCADASTSLPCSPVPSFLGQGLLDPLGTFRGPWAQPSHWLGALIKKGP